MNTAQRIAASESLFLIDLIPVALFFYFLQLKCDIELQDSRRLLLISSGLLMEPLSPSVIRSLLVGPSRYISMLYRSPSTC